MNRALRILFVEDTEDDMALIIHALERNGYDLIHQRVETVEGLHAALDAQAWDLIISD
jgi:two-component system, NarL family, sensor histidine kinase UhpB